jgi:serine/threonine protein kinase
LAERVSEPAGIKFGHFTLGKRLARGGMAEVFLARQRGPEGFDRKVAVKRILPHLAETADFVRMFLSEARLAARLSHPTSSTSTSSGRSTATTSSRWSTSTASTPAS